MGISERLVYTRERAGCSRSQLARELGRPYSTITKYETGEREPSHAYLVEVARRFGVSADYLLTGEIIDKDLLILADKMSALTPDQIRIVENIIDECRSLFGIRR